jgi:hypothetical protein
MAGRSKSQEGSCSLTRHVKWQAASDCLETKNTTSAPHQCKAYAKTLMAARVLKGGRLLLLALLACTPPGPTRTASVRVQMPSKSKSV